MNQHKRVTIILLLNLVLFTAGIIIWRNLIFNIKIKNLFLIFTLPFAGGFLLYLISWFLLKYSWKRVLFIKRNTLLFWIWIFLTFIFFRAIIIIFSIFSILSFVDNQKKIQFQWREFMKEDEAE